MISDFQAGHWSDSGRASVTDYRSKWIASQVSHAPHSEKLVEVTVTGGYIDRLPLAVLKSGLADRAEVWTHWRGETPPNGWTEAASPWITRRAFRMDNPVAPFESADMLGHIEALGPPEMLCVWGLGVSEATLLACRDSFKIYNSIDAPALRIPPEVSRHFDLVLTGATWQSDVVRSRHPEMPTVVMPIGPEFASDTTFKPLGLRKIYDVIYVAAAQHYKRHDILFDALSKLPRSLQALCVFGYGELVNDLRARAGRLGINVDFIEPPGVPIAAVNRLMNLARMGVVCGIDDGAPAILTEYMLAGIPVLANSALTCGLQYITPATGATATAENFHDGIQDVLGRLDQFSPREVVQKNWTWPHTIKKLSALIRDLSPGRT